MKFIIFLSAVALASCGPVAQDESVLRLVVENFVNCMNSDLSLCLKEHALKATERLGTLRHLKITEGVTIINSGPKEAKSLELSTDPEVRKKEISEKLWESTTDLLKNSELELSYAAPDDEEDSRAIGDAEEGRGKKKELKKKLKVLVPLLLLAKAKAVVLVVFSLLVIALSLFKLAVLAKIAFIAKALAIIKLLLSKKHHEEHEEHAWVPHHEEHGGHGWESGWSRSRNEANNLAYSAYTN